MNHTITPTPVEQVVARDAWTRDQVLEHQQAALRGLIEHAVSASPFYREHLGPDAVDADLRDLPVLTKTTMMERFDDVVTDDRLRRALVEEHIAGPQAGELFAGEFTVVTTSGTTGERGVFAYTRAEMATWLAQFLRVLGRLGVRPGARVCGIGSPSPLFLSRRTFQELSAPGPDAPPDLSVVTPIEQIVPALNEYRPDALVGYPSVTALLAEEQLAGRLSISPTAVGLGSEVLTADQAERIMEAWGVRPGNAYVTTEVAPIAANCPEGVGLHVNEDVVVLEVVDDDYQPVPAGQPGSRVLVTNLVNRAQPLIRYEITDSVTEAPGPNPTGRPWRRIAEVDGRTSEILEMPSAAGPPVKLHPHQLREPLARYGDVLQYQFEVAPTRVAVSLVVRPGAEPTVAVDVRNDLAAVLDRCGVAGVDVRADVVDSIAREPGGAAKLKQIRVVDDVGA